MAKRKKAWGSGRKVHSGRQMVRYVPQSPTVVVTGGGGGLARRRGGGGGGGGRRAKKGGMSPSQALVAGAVAGAVVVLYMRSKHGQDMSKNSQLVKEHGWGPFLAGAGYALRKASPRHAKYGNAAMTVGAFLTVAKKMNDQQGVTKVTIAGEQPSLEAIKAALRRDQDQ